MITRIVKLSFEEKNVAEFLKIFENSKHKIRAMSGCNGLELLNDLHSPTIFFTYSKWNTEQDLNNYRNSDLFKSVWANTKILFNDKPEAWSVKSINAL